MAEEEINAAVHPGPDGGFWAEVEDCPGCVTQAENYTEALERLRDAHRAWGEASAPVSSPDDVSDPEGEVPLTAGRVAAWLVAAGWSCTKATDLHFVFVKSEPLVKVTVPKSGPEKLNEGYREALKKAVSVA